MASWTVPGSHATGDDFSVTDYTTLANNELFLYQQPYANYYNSVTTSVSTATTTQVTLGGTTASGYGFSVSSNNVIVPLTGVYWVAGTVWFSSGSATGIVDVSIQHNGAGILTSRVPNSTSLVGPAVSGIVTANASDTIGLYTQQNSGGTLSTEPGANFTNISVMFVGSQ